MKTAGKLIIFIFTFLALATNAHAQSPREQLKQMVQQLQKTPNDNSLREKIIKIAVTLKPAPEISEEARRSFIIGEALFKQAKNLRPAYEAANAFWTATTLAPWWSNAYWNLAVAQQLAGQYVSAKESLRLYLLTNPSAVDRRTAQDRLYAIDADIIAAASSVPGGISGFWQRSSYQSLTDGQWIKDHPDSVRNTTYEIQQTGSALGIKCMTCYSGSEEKLTVNVVSSNSDAITFQMRLVSPWYDSGIENHACRLDDNQLSCTITYAKDGKNFNVRYAKRSICEIVGGPGIQGYFVLCK
jgi:hypothetical protein